MKAHLSVLLLLSCAPLLPGNASTTTPDPAPFHCQVPCGIYGDQMRIDMLMEDVATIEKAMAQITELSAASPVNYNQLVRWVTTKDEHAQKIQQTALDYWLAQRIKAPAADAGADATEKYHRQLALMHGVIVSAMKCKQTTDAAHPAAVKQQAMAFAGTYFGPEDLQHLREHHGDEHK
jgi:nickel superoxide dismutase